MPRITELKPNYMEKDIGLIVSGLMKKKKISPKEMGSYLGISRQALVWSMEMLLISSPMGASHFSSMQAVP